jgi:hypothetical protein
MSEIAEIARMLVDLQHTLDACDERGPVFDQYQGRVHRAIERLRAFPERVADQGPFLTAAAAEVVLRRECDYILAAIDGAN